jgi:hypothetical protein
MAEVKKVIGRLCTGESLYLTEKMVVNDGNCVRQGRTPHGVGHNTPLYDGWPRLGKLRLTRGRTTGHITSPHIESTTACRTRH